MEHQTLADRFVYGPVLPREGPKVVGVRAVDAVGRTIARRPLDRYSRN